MSPVCSPVCPGIRRTAFCVLLLSGLCSCFRNYFFIPEPKTWREAQSYCRENYGDLASLSSHEDVGRLIEAVGSSYRGQAWIGLYDIPNSWRWVLTDWGLYEKEEWNYRRWSPGEPEDVRPRGITCVVAKNGYWFDTSCGRQFDFICYNNTDLPSIKRHFLINEEKNWNNARNYCQQHYTDLTSVRNDAERLLIQSLLAFDQLAYIGLYRFTWLWWSSGLNNGFENWANGHPRTLDHNCAATLFSDTELGKWVENRCDERLHFICESNKRFVFHFKLTALKSTIDLNDPAVTEAALNLIEEKMNETGIGGDLKISWLKKPGNIVFHKEEKKTVVVT